MATEMDPDFFQQLVVNTLDGGVEMYKPPKEDTGCWNFSTLSKKEFLNLKQRAEQITREEITKFNPQNGNPLVFSRTQDVLYGIEMFISSSAPEPKNTSFFSKLEDRLYHDLSTDISSIQRTRTKGSIVVIFQMPLKIECCQFLIKVVVMILILLILIWVFIKLTSFISDPWISQLTDS